MSFIQKSLICLGVFQLIVAAQSSSCGDGNWWAYKDEKCFKIVETISDFNDAIALCSELPSDDEVPPALAIINNSVEQEFLNNKIYVEAGFVDDLWIGGKRANEDGDKFEWINGSPFAFVNWEVNSPSNDSSKSCVKMGSHLGKTADGQWTDVSCLKRNFVLCEKKQTWSLSDLRKIVLELRNNPLPLGFIYVQLPDQPSPTSQWPLSNWEEITAEYAGLFFRAEGAGSAQFGEIQAENSKRITDIGYDECSGTGCEPLWYVELPNDSWSPKFVSGRAVLPGANYYETMIFHTNVGENRPRNSAVRIWKRI